MSSMNRESQLGQHTLQSKLYPLWPHVNIEFRVRNLEKADYLTKPLTPIKLVVLTKNRILSMGLCKLPLKEVFCLQVTQNVTFLCAGLKIQGPTVVATCLACCFSIVHWLKEQKHKKNQQFLLCLILFRQPNLAISKNIQH